MAHDPVAAHCDHEVGCITCGDSAVAMRALSVDSERGLAVCSDEVGATETVETSLVAPVEEGDLLLVHAAVALQRLEEVEAQGDLTAAVAPAAGTGPGGGA